MKNSINIKEILPYIIGYLDNAANWDNTISTLEKDNVNDKEIYRGYYHENILQAETLVTVIVDLCYDNKEETITYKGIEVNKQLYLDYISYFTPKNT